MWLIKENWELICICFGIFVNLLGLVYNVIRYVRAGGLRRAGDWQELLGVLRKYECEAEGVAGLDGAAKLEYVLEKMREYTDVLGEVYDRESLTEMISRDIDFANEINAVKSERLE